MKETSITTGFLLFPRLTQLDLTGPYEVMARVPGGRVELVAKTMDPVVSDRGLAILPTATFTDHPPFDVLCIPGGPGTDDVLSDEETLAFVREAAATARWVTSVCTGALLLGAAGLLQGRKATTHWLSHHMLAAFGAVPTEGRVVRDGNVVTGGGVTAGIDFALWLVGEELGREAAERILLAIEYRPDPPFQPGEALIEAVREAAPGNLAGRQASVDRAAARLGSDPRFGSNTL